MNSQHTGIQQLAHEEIEATLARLEALAKVMDSAFLLPGTNVRMGFDALLGIIPVIGDLIGQAISSYLIWEAKRLGVSRFTLWRMIGNSAIDTVVGFIPFAGDAFDVVFRSNTKNLALLKVPPRKAGVSEPQGGGTTRRKPRFWPGHRGYSDPYRLSIIPKVGMRLDDATAETQLPARVIAVLPASPDLISAVLQPLESCLACERMHWRSAWLPTACSLQ